jgi:biotin carboxylase
VSADPRVLVVGTTTDYIDWIRRTSPGRAFFLTDPGVRHQATEPSPPSDEEILCDLTNTPQVLNALERHLEDRRLQLSGIACFDCESMILAAVVASIHNLPYPSVEAVRRCRDKAATKAAWKVRGIPCPQARRISSIEAAEAFSRETKGTIVLKPATGSGSELVFACRGPEESRTAFTEIERGLRRRQHSRMYRVDPAEGPVIIAEEFIEGEEFSCDFIIENRQIRIIRLTRKIRSPKGPFGTIRGYVLIDDLPGDIPATNLRRRLREGAEALGIYKGVCMVDLIVRNGDIRLLELSPRPGGDCLPFLIRESMGIDMLKLSLDVAENRQIALKSHNPLKSYVGLRLFADRPGVVEEIDWRRLAADPRVSQVTIIRKPSDTIRMPPEDYDSWLLGHVIFTPSENGTELTRQCDDLAGRIALRMAPC